MEILIKTKFQQVKDTKGPPPQSLIVKISALILDIYSGFMT